MPIHQLTIFIGENDAGKTALLAAFELLLTAKSASPNDFRRKGDGQETSFTVTGHFHLGEHDAVPPDWRAADGTGFVLSKIFTQQGVTCELEGLGFQDARWNSFSRQSAGVQKELLATLGLTPGANEPTRTAQFENAVAEGKLPKSPTKLEVVFGDIAQFLPRFERIASSDYRQPDTMVQRVMQAVVDGCIRPTNPETGERVLISELEPIEGKVRAALNAKAAEMQSILQQHNPKVQKVEIAPVIDFSRSVTSTSLLLDLGSGLRPATTFGEGSKKKLWMGLLAWERATQEELDQLAVIRAYDEPDVNLDYAAERQLFSNILQTSREPASRAQAIVCTHAMTFVDRAPAESINLIKVDDLGERRVEYVEGADDDDIRGFLDEVGRSVGLSNSALFYERAFLVVEGESEENAVPLLYQHAFNRSLLEDGIVLVNLHTCSAWKGILKVLLRQRSQMTVMLLDHDCKSPDSSGYITAASLTEIGYPATFQATSCFYVGAKEFEDAFASEDIAAVLDAHWPHMDGAWGVEAIDGLRASSAKFSDDLLKLVRGTCQPTHRNSAKKPEFAARLAKHCRTLGQIPSVVQDAFLATRQRAGCLA